MAAAQGRRSLRGAAAVAFDAAQLSITREARAGCIFRSRSTARFDRYSGLQPWRYTDGCLNALRAATDSAIASEVIVVDDASTRIEPPELLAHAPACASFA